MPETIVESAAKNCDDNLKTDATAEIVEKKLNAEEVVVESKEVVEIEKPEEVKEELPKEEPETPKRERDEKDDEAKQDESPEKKVKENATLGAETTEKTE